jgi:hypothetical protein
MVQNPEYPHIRLDGEPAVFEKGYGRGGKTLTAGGLRTTQFKNKLNDVLSVQDIRAQFTGKLFFELLLRTDYYRPIAQQLFQQLGVSVRSVITGMDGDGRRVIVSGPPDLIRKYQEKSKYNQELLKCIEDIKLLDPNAKIADSLKRRLEAQDDAPVDIAFVDEASSEEMDAMRKWLGQSVERVKFGKISASASALLSKEEIRHLAEIPIVKRISEKAIWKATALSRVAPVSSSFRIAEPSSNDLPKVCVIDTGIAGPIESYAEPYSAVGDAKDIHGHGTAVASLCMFKKDDLAQSSVITPTVKVISHKISEENENGDINFMDELLVALDQHLPSTRIFCLSWNCVQFDDIAYEDRLRELDRFLQERNILLVNSAGNLDREILRGRFQDYPKYLMETPVMTPSETKYTFSVGSTHNETPTRPILSSFNRLCVPLSLVTKPEDLRIRIKPEVFAEGGFIKPGDSVGTDAEYRIVCLDTQGNKSESFGTSMSAPQIARIAGLLEKKYGYQNAEMLKSIIFVKCHQFMQRLSEKDQYEGRVFESEDDVLDADDGFYFFFEGETHPHERLEDEKKDRVDAMIWKFPLTEEVDSLDIVVCHSNNNRFEGICSCSTRIVTSIHKPGKKGPLSKEKGTIGKNAPLVYGRYRIARGTPEGFGSVKAYVETTGIPRELFPEIKIRYGVAIKINLKPQFLHKKREVYMKILRAMGKDVSAYIDTEVIEQEGTYDSSQEAPA